MTGMDDEHFMRAALAQAEQGRRTEGGGPIGCVIVRDGKVLGEAHNEVGILHDPTAHAEMLAIRRACERLGTADLRGATLYTTLQPCGMCSMGSIWSHIDRIVYGACRKDVHRMYFEERHIDVLDIIDDAFTADLTATACVLEHECAALYYKPDDSPPQQEQTNV